MAARCSLEAQRQQKMEKIPSLAQLNFDENTETAKVTRVGWLHNHWWALRIKLFFVKSNGNRTFFGRGRICASLPDSFTERQFRSSEKMEWCRLYFWLQDPEKYPLFAHPQTKKKSTPKGVKKGQRWSKSKVDVHNSVHKHSKSSVGTTKRIHTHRHTHTHRFRTNSFFVMSRNNEAMNEMSFRFLCKMAFLAPKRVVFSIHLT